MHINVKNALWTDIIICIYGNKVIHTENSVNSMLVSLIKFL